MSRFKRVVFAAFLLRLILLTGCQHLIIDTDGIVRADTNLPEIVGIIAGFGTTFAAFPDFLAMMGKEIERGHESPDVRNYGRVSDPVGVLRPAHRFAAGHYLECYCSVHQFSHRWGVRLFPAQGKGKVSYRRRIEIEFVKESIHETVRSNTA
jgi:hypothetical protein